MAIRSLSFALKAVVVPQPRLFTVVNNVAYGYPLEEDPLGLIVKARWNDRVAELYSALTEQPAANHPGHRADAAPALALERLQALADTWMGQGRSLLRATLDHLAGLRPDDRLDMESTINALDFADEMSPELRAVVLPLSRPRRSIPGSKCPCPSRQWMHRPDLLTWRRQQAAIPRHGRRSASAPASASHCGCARPA